MFTQYTGDLLVLPRKTILYSMTPIRHMTLLFKDRRGAALQRSTELKSRRNHRSYVRNRNRIRHEFRAGPKAITNRYNVNIHVA